MINAISGKLLYIIGSKAVISTAFGIEFEVIVSSRTAATLLNYTDKERENVRLLIYFQHREDNVTLFGFLTEAEKSLYIELIKINGIGSKQALRILSGLSIDEFYECLNDTNIKSLAKIPGLGLKTAQKIVLALKDKLVPIVKDKKTEKRGISVKELKYSAVLDSLTDMGFEKDDANNAVLNIVENNEKELEKLSDSQREEEVFKRAFEILSNNRK